jgi:hypothetical protein
MGFLKNVGRSAAAWSTGGLSELYLASQKRNSPQSTGGGGGQVSVDSSGIVGQFQNILGRAPTQSEINYFSKFIGEGQLQEQEIGQILQSTPEFQQTLLQKNTQQFGDQLNQQNSAILDQAAAATNSRFASLGRSGSSAMAASVAQAGGQLAQQRQSALAQFYGQGLQNNAANQYRQGQDALSRGYGRQEEARGRSYQMDDYYRQQNDYNTAKKSSSGWNAITPEFVAGGLFSVGGKAAAAYTGGLK